MRITTRLKPRLSNIFSGRDMVYAIIPIERHRCTMARCQSGRLPRSSKPVADVLELAHRKDLRRGDRLMRQMAKPLPPGARSTTLRRLSNGSVTYCVMDVEVEREVARTACRQLSRHRTGGVGAQLPDQRARFPHLDRCPSPRPRGQIVRAAGAGARRRDLLELTATAPSARVSQVRRRVREWLQRQGHATDGGSIARRSRSCSVTTHCPHPLAPRVLELRLGRRAGGGEQASTRLFACADADDRVRGAFRLSRRRHWACVWLSGFSRRT